MTDIQHSMRKTEQHFLFDVQLNWLSAHRGILSARDVKGAVYVATPPAFGGEEGEWSPEHLFLGAVSSCFMTTLLVFAKKLKVDLSHFECNAIGQVELIAGKYQFTRINVYPKVYVADETFMEKAGLALQKTQQYCLVSNSIKAEIIYHPEVLKDPHPRLLPQT